MLSWSGAGASRPPPADSTRPSGISIEIEWYMRGFAAGWRPGATCWSRGSTSQRSAVPVVEKSLTTVGPPMAIASPVGSMVTLWKERALAIVPASLHTGDPAGHVEHLATPVRRRRVVRLVGVEGRATPPVMRNLPGANDVQAPNGTCVVPSWVHALVAGSKS